MTTQLRYIVIYKDGPKARNIYFGPFVSQGLAEHVMNELPLPLEGGYKTYKSLSRFTSFNVHVANQMIMDERNGFAVVAA